MELPKPQVPSPVWPERADGVYSCLPHAPYFSLASGFVSRGSVENQERGRWPWSASSGRDKLPCQVVKSAPGVVKRIPRDQGHISRDVSHRFDVRDVIAGLLVLPGDDDIWIGFKKEADCSVNVSDVLFGPF